MTKQQVPGLSKLVNLLQQANELRSRGEYQAALEIYFNALHQFDESVELLAMIASCYFHLSKYYEAVFFIEKALRIAPDDARLHAALGEYHVLGTLEVELAAEEYRRAIELNPNYAAALADAAILLGDLPEEVVTMAEAISWLERATQIEPDNPNYHFSLGEMYWEAGRVAEAEHEWIRALLCSRPLHPDNAETIRKRLSTDND